MALLPPRYMNAVVALGYAPEDGDFVSTATGFLYSRTSDGEDGNWLFIVTNRHVADSSDLLYCRFNENSGITPLPPEGSARTMPWTVHPNPEVDAAAMMFDANAVHDKNNRPLAAFSDVHTKLPFSIAISEGDGVFVLGFPLGLAGGERNYVIARQGIVARTKKEGEHTFLIDAFVFPGNSGGPVLSKPEGAAISGTGFNTNSSLIGMVSSYLAYEDVAVSQQTGRPRIIFQENSGLAEVVPIHAVQETVDLAFHDAMERMGR